MVRNRQHFRGEEHSALAAILLVVYGGPAIL